MRWFETTTRNVSTPGFAAEPRASLGSTPAGYIGGPANTPGGAVIATQGADNLPDPLFTFNDCASGWAAGESTSLLGANAMIPGLGVTGTGSPLVVVSTYSGQYRWSLRTGATWSAAATVPSITPPGGFGGGIPAVVMATRTNVDEIVAAFTTSPSMGNVSLTTMSFTGAWSGALPVATDVTPRSAVTTPARMVALPNGRLALAYATADARIKACLMGSGPFCSPQYVPISLGAPRGAPFAIAPGFDSSVVLEVVAVDANGTLQHVRLTAESGWIWSTPTPIDPRRQYDSVAIAVGP